MVALSMVPFLGTVRYTPSLTSLTPYKRKISIQNTPISFPRNGFFPIRRFLQACLQSSMYFSNYSLLSFFVFSFKLFLVLVIICLHFRSSMQRNGRLSFLGISYFYRIFICFRFSERGIVLFVRLMCLFFVLYSKVRLLWVAFVFKYRTRLFWIIDHT